MADIEDMGGDSKFTLIRMAGTIDGDDSNEESGSSNEEIQSEKRTGWDNKIQYILAQIGFAVGLGNVWRFPYLCQKNGGGAFLIPYTIMLVLEGIPLFYLEIAIGQRKRRGSVGVWNLIHPYLGGVGIASMVVCFLIAVYYNMIIAWALFYFWNSFTSVLPWNSCPTEAAQVVNVTTNMLENVTKAVRECEVSSATSYYWFRETLDISGSIEESGVPVATMVGFLALAWVIAFVGTFKGIKSSGKIIYFSATFPYVVLIAYFIRGITLDGAVDGLVSMFTPDMSKLLEPNVWRDAATQIFFSLGLGFGGVIAYSSYNDVKNNCRRDALFVSIVNCGTSILASVVIFCILGFKAHVKSTKCAAESWQTVQNFIREHDNLSSLALEANALNKETYTEFFTDINATIYEQKEPVLSQWKSLNMQSCSIASELQQEVSGPGLAFIAFTEAMNHLPGGPFWSILFFGMLINLGLGSMFGTLEGIITPLRDLGLSIRKEIIVAVLCVVSFCVGLLFTLKSGMYFLGIFDTYAGTVPLLLIAFFETIAVIYIYGFDKFSDDLAYMIGDNGPGLYWKVTWKVLSPLCMIVLFGASVFELFYKTPQYSAYQDATGASDVTKDYPGWAVALIVLLILLSIVWIPIIAILRRFGLFSYMAVESQPKKQPETKEYL